MAYGDRFTLQRKVKLLNEQCLPIAEKLAGICWHCVFLFIIYKASCRTSGYSIESGRQCMNMQSQCPNYVLRYEQEEYDTTKTISEESVDAGRKYLTKIGQETLFLKIRTAYKERTTCLIFSEVKAQSIPYFSPQCYYIKLVDQLKKTQGN